MPHLIQVMAQTIVNARRNTVRAAYKAAVRKTAVLAARRPRVGVKLKMLAVLVAKHHRAAHLAAAARADRMLRAILGSICFQIMPVLAAKAMARLEA